MHPPLRVGDNPVLNAFQRVAQSDGQISRFALVENHLFFVVGNGRYRRGSRGGTADETLLCFGHGFLN